MGTFFSILQKGKISPKMDIIFLPKKKIMGGGGEMASLLASKKDNRWTGNRSFFRVASDFSASPTPLA